MTHAKSLRIDRIDRIVCTGRGLCAELLPELIGLEWGYPSSRTEPYPTICAPTPAGPSPPAPAWPSTPTTVPRDAHVP